MLTLVFADCEIVPEEGKIDGHSSHPRSVHFSLLLAYDSCLSEERELKAIIHTRSGDIFKLESDVKIPEKLDDFNRMLLDTVGGDYLKGITHLRKDLMEVLSAEMGTKLVMSPSGDREDVFEYLVRAEDYVIVIGGFSEGDFVSPVYEWADKVISISDSLKKPWSVTAQVITAYHSCSLE